MSFCKKCLRSVPYATLIATILCLLGVVIFSFARQRGAVVTKLMLNEFYKENENRLATFDLAALVIEIVTAVIAAMILVVGILATGDTRARVYNAWRARIGGRLSCAFLMVLTLVLFFLWLFVLWVLAFLGLVVTVSEMQCEYFRTSQDPIPCLHVSVTNVFVKEKVDDLKICLSSMIKKFCKDFVEKATPAYHTATVGSVVVIFSLVLFSICLAANYARIRCQSKFQELQELRELGVDERSSKDRF